MYAAPTPIRIRAPKLLHVNMSVKLCGIYRFSLLIQWKKGTLLTLMKDGYARNNSVVRGGLEGYWKSVRRIQEEVDLMKMWF